jgi:hypothetical protein
MSLLTHTHTERKRLMQSHKCMYMRVCILMGLSSAGLGFFDLDPTRVLDQMLLVFAHHVATAPLWLRLLAGLRMPPATLAYVVGIILQQSKVHTKHRCEGKHTHGRTCARVYSRAHKQGARLRVRMLTPLGCGGNRRGRRRAC